MNMEDAVLLVGGGVLGWVGGDGGAILAGDIDKVWSY